MELPQVEETGCFGAALAARVGTGFITTSAKPNVTLRHPVRTPAARYDRPSALPKISTLSASHCRTSGLSRPH
ncbi:hypothetical protein ACP0HM_22060 [Escherichia coli]